MVITRIPVPDMVTSSLLLTVPAFGRVWQLSPVFGPIFSPDGSLIALEMLSRIADRDSGVAASPEMFFAQIPLTEQRRILVWQLEVLTLLAPWCATRRLSVSLNVSRTLALRILADPVVSESASLLAPWLRLEVSERFLSPDNRPEQDPLLSALQPLAPLWLDDFGAGTTGLTWLLSGVFEGVKLDRHLFRDLTALPEGPSFLCSLATLVRAQGAQLIAEGVETQELLEVVACSGLDACQGWLWPEVVAAQLADLPDHLPSPTEHKR